MNVYLISSNSNRIIDNEVKKIVKDNKYLTMNLNKISFDEVLKEVNYCSFMDDKKYIVVSNITLFDTSKSDELVIKELLDYLEHPNENATIIFTTLNGIDLRKKQTKLIKEKYQLINILPFDKRMLNTEISNYLRSKNYSIDYESIVYLIDNANSNYDIILNELDKIMIYYNKPCKVSFKDLKNIVGLSLTNNNFSFVSAVVNKDLRESLRILKDLKVYKVESIALLMLLAREYRLMFYLKRYQAKGLNMASICKEMKMMEWQVNKLYTNGLKYSEVELLNNLKKISIVDIGIKSGNMEKDVSMINFLVDVCS
ncbi:MAG: DNA polymerase III subunit delta [Bacilli bacterium]